MERDFADPHQSIRIEGRRDETVSDRGALSGSGGDPSRCDSEAHCPVAMVSPRIVSQVAAFVQPLFTNLCLSFRHRNRHCLASAPFGDPDRVARGLDCGWCLESFFDYRDAGLIAIDSNHGNLAAAILSNE
jgi:hypothetical protein